MLNFEEIMALAHYDRVHGDREYARKVHYGEITPLTAEELGMKNYSVPVSIFTEEDPESGLKVLRIVRVEENQLETEANKH